MWLVAFLDSDMFVISFRNEYILSMYLFTQSNVYKKLKMMVLNLHLR